MKKEFEKCYKNNTIISIYADGDSFVVGYINAFTEEQVLISSISQLGEYDGYVLMDYCNIIKFCYGDSISKKRENLYTLKKQSHDSLDANSDELIDILINYAQLNKKIVSIAFLNDDSDMECGFVDNYDDKSICLKSLNSSGDYDGYIVINLDSIAYIQCDGDYEQDLNLILANK